MKGPKDIAAFVRDYGLFLSFTMNLVLGGLLAWSYLSGQFAQTELRATLEAHAQALKALEVRDSQRQQKLNTELQEIEHTRQSVRKPQEIAQEIPRYVPLPVPLQYVSPVKTSESPSLVPPSHEEAPTGGATPAELPLGPAQARISDEGAFIPAVDLPALWDFIQDCRACDAKLRSAQEALKIAQEQEALITQERDVAIKAAKGGGFWRRLHTGLKWFAGGAVTAVVVIAAAGL